MHRTKSALTMTVLSILCTLLVTFLVYYLNVPNPVIVLVAVMILFEVIGGWAPGAVSGVLIVIYALFYFSTYHRFQTYTAVASYKCFVVAVSMFVIYLMVGKLRQYANHMYQRLVDVNKNLKESNEELAQASYHDALTGLYNRRGGRKVLSGRLAWTGGTKDAPVKTDEAPGIFVVLDIDDFKHFNDVYGHSMGDRVLQHMAREMESVFPAGSVLMRQGGDEFSAFIPAPDRKQVEKKLEEFSRKNFSFTYQGKRVTFHVSCGYALYPQQAHTLVDLHALADTALYYVKMNGKQGTALYDVSMDPEARMQFRFSMLDIFTGLPVAIIIYQADATEKILLATQSAIELFGCHTLQEFMQYTGGRFRNLVHPDDVDRVEKSINDQISANSYQMDSVEYRIIAKDHKVKPIHDLGRLVDHPKLGKLFYVVLYDKDTLSI